eukprot:gene10365-11275_t
MDADIFVDYVYELFHQITRLWAILQPLALLQYPYTKDIAFACNSINGTLGIYAATSGNQLYWVHELVLVVIGTFGGGIVTPMLLGKPSLVLNNDVIVFCCVVAWYVVFYLKGHIWLNYPPIKTAWLVFVGFFRTMAATNMVQLGYSVFVPSVYYPTPVFGPIIAGTLVGSFGMFLPFDKGLTPIKNNGPWVLQGAFYSSVFYHFMVNDTKGFIGITLRQILGDLSKSTVLSIIAILQVIHLQLQYYISPDSNLFTPLHKFLYLIFQVNGPKVTQKPPVNGVAAAVGWDKAARKKTKILIDISRILLVIVVIVAHVYFHISPLKIKTEYLPWDMTHSSSPAVTTTGRGGPSAKAPASPLASFLSLFSKAKTEPLSKRDQTVNRKVGVTQKLVLSETDFESFAIHALPMNETIGSCQYFTNFRKCVPYLARLEEVTCAEEENLPYPADLNQSSKEDPTTLTHPFCNVKDKNYAADTKIYRLAVYQTSVYRYLATAKLPDSKPIYTIPLSLVDVFDTKELEILHRDKSLLHLSPSLHVSTDGWVVLLKPIKVVGHSVTILYNHIGNIQAVSSSSEASHCGYLPQSLAVTKNSAPQLRSSNKAVNAIQFAKNGQLIATCDVQKKDEL